MSCCRSPAGRGPCRAGGGSGLSGVFRVGVTRDFLGADGRVSFGDVGLGRLDDAPGVEWEFLAEDRRELDAELVRDYDALLVLTPRVTAATLAGTDRLVIIARFGVGYDSVDVEACTRSGVPSHDHAGWGSPAGGHQPDHVGPRPRAEAARQGPPHPRWALGRARRPHGPGLDRPRPWPDRPGQHRPRRGAAGAGVRSASPRPRSVRDPGRGDGGGGEAGGLGDAPADSRLRRHHVRAHARDPPPHRTPSGCRS